MYNLILSKFGLRIIGIFVVIAAIAGMVYEFHYKPINELEEEISVKDQLIQYISNDYVKCTDTLQKLHLEGYINGVSDINDTVVIDLNNLHT